jgi:hypothetical protein
MSDLYNDSDNLSTDRGIECQMSYLDNHLAGSER